MWMLLVGQLRLNPFVLLLKESLSKDNKDSKKKKKEKKANVVSHLRQFLGKILKDEDWIRFYNVRPQHLLSLTA